MLSPLPKVLQKEKPLIPVEDEIIDPVFEFLIDLGEEVYEKDH